MSGLRSHYAVRVLRSVSFINETMWQPICSYSNTSKIRMTTVLKDVTCKNCRNMLIRSARRLGLSRQVNKVRREGKWYDRDNKK